MLTILGNIIDASFLVSILEISGIIGIIWAVLTVFLDAISRCKQNKLKEFDQKNELNNKRLALLDDIEGLIALPIRNCFPDGFKLRWETKPSIFFSESQPDIKNPPKTNTMYQTIFAELKFKEMTKVKMLFPEALKEYKDFINLSEKYMLKHKDIEFEQVSNSYDKFKEKCETIIIK